MTWSGSHNERKLMEDKERDYVVVEDESSIKEKTL